MIVLEIVTRTLFSLFFIIAGTTHFTNPTIYDSLVPAYLPNHRLLHLLAGSIEIILGFTLLTRWKSLGGLLLAIFLVIVYLANLNMWINGVPFLGNLLSTFTHFLRLILQILMIVYSLFIWRSFK